ncbi:MAG TPA: EexN family lipoprotein [Gammaproteobacteria bacterium]|nr:EexN family lipoprotein [Gammaproteobacteria bacterium]
MGIRFRSTSERSAPRAKIRRICELNGGRFARPSAIVRVFYVTAITSSFNVSVSVAIRRHRESGFRLRAGLTPLLAVVLAACAPKSEPRTVFDFMDDGFAREGVLTRCNQNRDETLNDQECNNARRAAAAIALEAERARAPALEQRSEARLAALRDHSPAGAEPTGNASASDAPAFGSPVGSVLPSLSPSPSSDEYAESTELLGRHAIEIDVEPPSNDLVIAPAIAVPELAVVPRPFRDEPAQR